MTRTLKNGSVAIEREGKTYTGNYLYMQGQVTVNSDVGTKAAHANSRYHAKSLARMLLADMVTENIDKQA